MFYYFTQKPVTKETGHLINKRNFNINFRDIHKTLKNVEKHKNKCRLLLIKQCQGFVNVFFFLFLDERNNRVRVTNCQSPFSPRQFFDLRRQRQLSNRPPDHGGPNFLFLALVTVVVTPHQ